MCFFLRGDVPFTEVDGFSSSFSVVHVGVSNAGVFSGGEVVLLRGQSPVG